MHAPTIDSRILKECFWDYDYTEDDLKQIIANADDREIKKLFSKIVYNATDKLQALQLFTQEQLKECFSTFKVTYNKKYISKHVLVLKSLLLNETHYIKGLEWEK